jgi:DNA-directed RNA polymerase
MNKVMNKNEIKNLDILDHIKNIEDKYYHINKILQNKDYTCKQKQIKIESDCLDTRSTNLSKFKVLPTFINMTQNIFKNPFVRKHKKIADEIMYIGNIDTIILYTFNECIMDYYLKLNREYITYTKVAMKLLENIEQHYKFTQVREYANTLHKNHKECYFNPKKPDKDTCILILIIMEEAEKNNILKISMKKNLKKQTRIVTFTKEYISKAYRSFIQVTNLPMIYKPNDWTSTTNKIYEFGGYLCSEHSNIIDLIHYNKDKSKQSLLKKDYIDQINYLQSQKFEIDKNNLEIYNENPKTFLDNYIISIKNYEEFLDDIKTPLSSLRFKAVLFKEYQKRVFEAKLLIETLYLANMYKDHKIYFPIYNDFRNRLYYHSYLLNIQGTKFARSLITIENHNITELISLDATASGLQILGTILKDEKLMNLTNILNDNDEDIYEYYKNKFNKSDINYLEDTIITKKNKTVFKTMKKKFIFNEKSRKLFKKLLMTYAYNKEIYGMAKDITESKMYLDLKPTEVFYHMTNLYKFFQNEFKTIEKFKLLILDIIKNTDNQFVILNHNSNFISTQLYCSQESETISFSYQKQRFRMTIKMDKEPPQINTTKTKKATMSNLIHSIDAHILYNVLKGIREKDIPVYTLHDCFVIPKKHIIEMKQIYLKELQNVYNSNLIDQFINNNIQDKEKNRQMKEKYKDILTNKKIILNNLRGLKEKKLKFEEFKTKTKNINDFIPHEKMKIDDNSFLEDEEI